MFGYLRKVSRQRMKKIQMASNVSKTLAMAFLLINPGVTLIKAQDIGFIDHKWTSTANAHPIGQASGVATDSHNHVFIFHRANRTWSDPMPVEPIKGDTIIMLDGDTGQKLAQWGAGQFIMPHGLSVDADDDVWVTDVGAHTVRKFDHAGKPLLTLGVDGVPGNDNTHFNMPADVDFDSDGNLYVADGYVNTRVVKFNSNGDYLIQWGTPGKKAGQLNLPHGIAVSTDEKVFVADRANSRMQVFNTRGELLKVVDRELVGRPYGVGLDAKGGIWIIDGGDQPDHTRAMVIQLGADFGKSGSFNANIDSHPGPLGHDITVARDGSVYVVDAWANRVIKIKSH